MTSSDNRPDKQVARTPSSRGEVDAFLKKVASLPSTNTGGEPGRLLFALDATASREQTWDRAMQLQAEMFSSTQSLGSLTVQLSYFRGFMDFYHSPWCTDSSGLLKQMTGIRCQAGITQIERLLRHALEETRKSRIHALVYVGDAMEENVDVLANLAGQLGMFNVPIFVFQEGGDPVAERAFKEMARLSKGAWSPFDGNSVGQLKDLLKAVAIYATGGLKALEHFSRESHPAVLKLTRQLGPPSKR